MLHGIATRAEAAQRERIMEIVDHHDEIIRRIRVTIFHLTERRDRVGGFQAQVSTVVDEAARILGFSPSLHCTGPVDTAATAAIVEHLVPSLREGLSNVARHARAGRVDVTLEYHEGCLTMRLVDDGVGLPARPDAAGNGLRNLARRAELLAGSLTISATDPHGTTITWSVPT
jgi:signal transduction histidine kinase